jgi:hypothetical protein
MAAQVFRRVRTASAAVGLGWFLAAAAVAAPQHAPPASSTQPAGRDAPAPPVVEKVIPKKDPQRDLLGTSFTGSNNAYLPPPSPPSAGGGVVLRGPFDATDNCHDAHVVGEGTHAFDTTGFSPGGPTTTCAGNTSANGWWVYAPSADGIATVTTCSLASFDTTLAAFVGSCASATQVACNDDACGLQSRISFYAALGTTYLIRISAYGAATVGAGAIDISLVPAGGGGCASATVINEGIYEFANTTFEGDITSCTFNDVYVAWFEYRATQTGSAVVMTCALAYFDTALSAWTGCGGAEIACNDDSCGLQSAITFPVVSGHSYWIRVSGFGGASDSGMFGIGVTSVECAQCPGNATVIENEPECGHEGGGGPLDTVNGGCNSSPPVFTPIAVGDIVCGTTKVVAPSSRDTDWYRFTLLSSTEVTWTVTAEFSVLLGFLLSPCPQTTFIPGGAVTGPACTANSVTLCLPPGTYYAFVASSTFLNTINCGGSGSRYIAQLTGVPCFPYIPPNDDCGTAIPLALGIPQAGDNTNANITTFLDGASGCTFDGAPANRDVWYTFTPPATGNYTINTCGSPLDTVLSVWTTCPGNQLAHVVACNDDFCDFQSQVTAALVASQTYFVRVAGWNNATGAFQIVVNADPPGGTIDIDSTIAFNDDQEIFATINLYIPGTLTGTGHILVSGTFNWYGGRQIGTGSTSVGSGTTLNMFGDGVMTLARQMTNLVAGNWTGGCLLLDGGQFANAPGAIFTISGQVEVLATEAGESFANHGDMIIAPGADATFGTGFALTNTGSMVISSVCRFEGDVTLDGVVELTEGGEITGPGNVTFTGTFIWSGGTMSGSGATIVAPDATLFMGDSNMTLSRRFENHSTAGSWTGGCLLMANGLFNNNAGASLDVFADPQIDVQDTGGENAFNNHGLITVHTGEFVIGVPGVNTGTIIVIPPDTLVLLEPWMYMPGSRLEGPGGVTFGGGVHAFPDGTFGITGPVGLLPGATLILPASSLPNYNAATNTFSGGDWVIGPGSTLTITGADIRTIGPDTSFTLLGDATLAALANLSRINGSLNLEDGAALSINPDAANGALVNNGRVRIGPGSTLNVAGSYQQTALGWLHAGVAGTTGNLVGRLICAGAAALDGTVELSHEGAYSPARGDNIRFVHAAGASGAFSSVIVPAPAPNLRHAVAVDALGARHVVTHVADWNNDLVVNVPDIFDFLTDWFAGRADFDGLNGTDVPDIFAFLAAWFSA